MTAPLARDLADRSDAELAVAAAAGDRGAFARIYDRYADRLHDFCAGMLRDRDLAADCVQDVFCTAATRLDQLREPDKLRPWLYSIARNEALRHIRARRSERLYEEVPDMTSCEAGPDTLAARSELADLIAEAAGGLSDRDRAVLELTYRHGLDGPELAEALDVTPANANVMVFRLRETIERSLGALLVARRAARDPDRCPDLAAVLHGWDGEFTILMRKRIARHIQSCPTCEQDRRRLVNPVALLGGAPVFIPAPTWLRAHTLSRIQLTCATTALSASSGTSPGPQPAPPPPHLRSTAAAPVGDPVDAGWDHVEEPASRGGPGPMAVIALFAVTLLTSLGVTIAWLHHSSIAVGPAGLSSIAPAPVVPAVEAPPINLAPPAGTVAAVPTLPAAAVPTGQWLPPVAPTAAPAPSAPNVPAAAATPPAPAAPPPPAPPPPPPAPPAPAPAPPPVVWSPPPFAAPPPVPGLAPTPLPPMPPPPVFGRVPPPVRPPVPAFPWPVRPPSPRGGVPSTPSYLTPAPGPAIG